MNPKPNVMPDDQQGITKTNEPSSAETVARLREAGLSNLSVPDVLDALRKNGVQDLEQLVKAQLKSAREEVYRPDSLNLYGPTPASGLNDRIVHRVPQMPVNIDGVLYDPADIQRFNGQPLHFVLNPDSDGSQLDAYTGTQWSTAIRSYFQMRHMMSQFDAAPAFPLQPLDFPIPTVPSTVNPTTPPPSPFPPLPGSPGAPRPQPSVPPPPPPRPTESQFFSDSNFGGDWLWLGPHLAWSDLTKVKRAKFLFFSSDWNDVISSIHVWAGTITVYEDINYGGSSMTLRQGIDIDDLTPSGWNDRISSIVNWG